MVRFGFMGPDKHMNRQKESNLVYLLDGFMVGTFFAIVLAMIFLVFRFKSLSYVIPQSTNTAILLPSTPTDSPTLPVSQFDSSPTFTLTPTSSWEPADLLERAATALNDGHPETVIDLLFPAIEGWTSPDEIARGYELLGTAELYLGHAQLAAPFFERLYFYKPTADNLLSLAMVYDEGGDIDKALERYQELAAWEDLPQYIDRDLINSRIEDISRAMGTPVPTRTPTPTP